MFLELKVWSKCSVAYKYLIESLLNTCIFSLTEKWTVLNFYVSFIQMESNRMSTKNPGRKTVLNWFACPWVKKKNWSPTTQQEFWVPQISECPHGTQTTINQSFSTLEILLVSTCCVYTLIMSTKTISSIPASPLTVDLHKAWICYKTSKKLGKKVTTICIIFWKRKKYKMTINGPWSGAQNTTGNTLHCKSSTSAKALCLRRHVYRSIVGLSANI